MSRTAIAPIQIAGIVENLLFGEFECDAALRPPADMGLWLMIDYDRELLFKSTAEWSEHLRPAAAEMATRIGLHRGIAAAPAADSRAIAGSSTFVTCTQVYRIETDTFHWLLELNLAESAVEDET